MNAEELILKWYDCARRVAASLALRSGGDVDEAIGDAMVALTRAAQNFDDTLGVPFSAYLVRRVQWAVIAGERRRSGRGPIARRKREHLELSESLISAVEDTDERLIREEDMAAVRLALAECTPLEQTVLREIYWDERKVTEIAAERGVSTAAVYDNARRARARIHRQLAA